MSLPAVELTMQIIGIAYVLMGHMYHLGYNRKVRNYLGGPILVILIIIRVIFYVKYQMEIEE
jgi:hypothetical protein